MTFYTFWATFSYNGAVVAAANSAKSWPNPQTVAIGEPAANSGSNAAGGR
jgi:hypothetical protein